MYIDCLLLNNNNVDSGKLFLLFVETFAFDFICVIVFTHDDLISVVEYVIEHGFQYLTIDVRVSQFNTKLNPINTNSCVSILDMNHNLILSTFYSSHFFLSLDFLLES